MNHHALAPGLTREVLLNTLADRAHRRVMIQSVHTHMAERDCLYRRPDEDQWFPCTPWDLFASTYTTKGLCVGREDREGKSYRRFDLTPDPYLRVVFEHKEHDKPWEVPAIVKEALRSVGLSHDYHLASLPGSGYPLKGFEKMGGHPRNRQVMSYYAASIPFLRPDVVREGWSTKDTPLWMREGQPYRAFLPPGMYPEGEFHADYHDYPMGVVVDKPDACHLCKGEKGETVHFTTRTPATNGVTICRACFRGAMAQVADLLDRV